jgi:hypothetical protein
MNTYKKLNDLIENNSFDVRLSSRKEIFLTDNVDYFNKIKSLIKSSQRKIIGYHAIDLRGADRIRISSNNTSIFKQVNTLSKCEKLAKYLFENIDNVRTQEDIKTQLEVFCLNYHPFDFFRFYEERFENKIVCSCRIENEIEKTSFNIGEYTLFLVDKISLSNIDFTEKCSTPKKINRKHNEAYSNTFEINDQVFIFEFSNKSMYRDMIEIIDY